MKDYFLAFGAGPNTLIFENKSNAMERLVFNYTTTASYTYALVDGNSTINTFIQEITGLGHHVRAYQSDDGYVTIQSTETDGLYKIGPTSRMLFIDHVGIAEQDTSIVSIGSLVYDNVMDNIIRYQKLANPAIVDENGLTTVKFIVANRDVTRPTNLTYVMGY
jgi:hypothetical protein